MKNIKYLKVVLLNVFVLLFILSNYNCGVNDVDGKNINITGVVTDESGNPIDSVLVVLYSILPVSRYVTALTNLQGHYSLTKFIDKNKTLYLDATKEFYENNKLFIYSAHDIIKTQWTDDPQVINIKVKLW